MKDSNQGSKIKQVRIISRGMGVGTKVIDIETGQEIENVYSIEISKIVPDNKITAKIEVIRPELDVVAMADVTTLDDPDQFRKFKKVEMKK